MLDILLAEMEFALSSQKWKNALKTVENGEVDEGGKGEEGEERSLEKMLGGMTKDYEYLKKMKKMDTEIQEQAKEDEEEGEGKERRRRVEMSDVVPVAGLIMARFHMYENELLTAVDMWGTHPEKTGFFLLKVTVFVFGFVRKWALSFPLKAFP